MQCPHSSASLNPMKTPLALEKMTVKEKLQVMEAIWDDLCQKEDQVPSPDWHGSVLAEREKRLASGETRFSDWEEAKERIRKRVR